jgi:CRP-like cAMP-binding protein
VGELSLIDGNRASATVTTEAPLEAFALYRTSFNKLLKSTPEMYQRLLVGMAGRIRSIDQRGDVTG